MALSNFPLADLAGQTVMLVGRPGSGKTTLARELATRLADAGTAALVSADMGQPALGVSMCMAVSLAPPWDRAAASWFIGDVTPLGNLAPVLVGVVRLIDFARRQGARSIVLDTTGMVEGPVARVLKYHKLQATQAARVIALADATELDDLLKLLAAGGAVIERRPLAPQATNRSLVQRQADRQERYRVHFAGARLEDFDWSQVLSGEWLVGRPAGSLPLRGRVVGLLDRNGFCCGLGLIEAADAQQLRVFTACANRENVHWLQIGRLRLDRHADFAELR